MEDIQLALFCKVENGNSTKQEQIKELDDLNNLLLA